MIIPMPEAGVVWIWPKGEYDNLAQKARFRINSIWTNLIFYFVIEVIVVDNIVTYVLI